MKKLTAKERRELIGSKVEWEELLDANRGVFALRSGVLEEVKGNNMMIDGDWKWYPNMINFRKGT